MKLAITMLRWKLAWRDFRQRVAAKCGSCGCIQSRGPWQRVSRRTQGVRMRGVWYCGAGCLERALSQILTRSAVSRVDGFAPHRIPLGLILLSRQQLTAEQLRAALELQREGGKGKIGECLRQLGFVSELQITAALARQWACPLLRTGAGPMQASQRTRIPLLLLESFQMIPVDFVAATGALLVAFSEGIDHTVLYAIEQMLGYRTEACFICPSTLREGLRALAQRREDRDVVFERIETAEESASIAASYAAKVGAEEVRLAQCGRHIWIRLERRKREAVSLILVSPGLLHSALRAPRERVSSLPA